MLVTVRAFALDRLDAADETRAARAGHGAHFDAVASKLRADSRGPGQLAALRRFEIEVGNFRGVLGYAFGLNDQTPSPQQVALGRRLCKSLGWFWLMRGYLGEGGRWLERSVACAADRDSLDLADNLARLADVVSYQGDYQRSRELAKASLAMARQHDGSRELVFALLKLGWALFFLGDSNGARTAFEEALEQARRSDNAFLLGSVVADAAEFESDCGNYKRANELTVEALALAKQSGDPELITQVELNLFRNTLGAGDLEQAQRLLAGVVTSMLRSGDRMRTVEIGEGYAQLLIKTEKTAAAASLLGACAAMRERDGVRRFPNEEAEREKLVEAGMAAMPAGEFQRHYEAGQMRTVEEVLAELGHTTDGPGAA
jgi:tetratricopeptide (TPR) repeat protein